jgi:hypothetical protein
LRKRAANVQEGPTGVPLGEGEYDIHNLVRGPFEGSFLSGSSLTTGADDEAEELGEVEECEALLLALASRTNRRRKSESDSTPLPSPPMTNASCPLRVCATVVPHALPTDEGESSLEEPFVPLEVVHRDSSAVVHPDSPYSSNALLEPYSKTPLAVSAVPPPALGSVLSTDEGESSLEEPFVPLEVVHRDSSAVVPTEHPLLTNRRRKSESDSTPLPSPPMTNASCPLRVCATILPTPLSHMRSRPMRARAVSKNHSFRLR